MIRYNTEIIYLPEPDARIRAFRDLIVEAEEVILLQMYLFAANGELQSLRPVSDVYPWARTVAQWLIDKKKNCPNIKIVVLLDSQTIEDPKRTHNKQYPLTRHYLEQNEIIVLNASLADTIYDKYRKFLKISHLHNEWTNKNKIYTKSNWINLQNYWQMIHNVEDHRKNMVIDFGRAAILTSHNLIDIAHRWHENTFLLRNESAQKIWKLGLESLEKAFQLPIQFSSNEIEIQKWFLQIKNYSLNIVQNNQTSYVKILSSGPEIKKSILEHIQKSLDNGIEEICIASAYYSDLQTLNSLLSISPNIRVRILIDDCRALPLLPIIGYLLQQTVNLFCIDFCLRNERIQLRLYPSTYTKMMHCKAIVLKGKKSSLIAGQANFTPNSFSGAWLETSLEINEEIIIKQFYKQFEDLWTVSKKIIPYSQLNWFSYIFIKLKTFLFLQLLKIGNWLGFRY